MNPLAKIRKEKTRKERKTGQNNKNEPSDIKINSVYMIY